MMRRNRFDRCNTCGKRTPQLFIQSEQASKYFVVEKWMCTLCGSSISDVGVSEEKEDIR